jgi:hypothetical protein
MLYEAEPSKDSAEAEERFMRSLEREEAEGLRKGVEESMYALAPEQECQYPGGIGIALDGERLMRIAEKVARAWFFRFRGKRFPENYDIMKYEVGNERASPLMKINDEAIIEYPEIVLGDRAFVMRVAIGTQDEFLTCWRIEFYGAFKVMVYSCKMNDDTFRIIDLSVPHVSYADPPSAA